jgi:hypothetical protein
MSKGARDLVIPADVAVEDAIPEVLRDSSGLAFRAAFPLAAQEILQLLHQLL